MAGDARDVERPGDSREGACGGGAAFFRGGSSGGAADRFDLGAQSFGERTSGSETARARARRLEWQAVQFTSKRYAPLAVSLSAKFTLWRDGFALEQGALRAGRSHLDVQAEMNSF